jgi:hypothetical protein
MFKHQHQPLLRITDGGAGKKSGAMTSSGRAFQLTVEEARQHLM